MLHLEELAVDIDKQYSEIGATQIKCQKFTFFFAAWYSSDISWKHFNCGICVSLACKTKIELIQQERSHFFELIIAQNEVSGDLLNLKK